MQVCWSLEEVAQRIALLESRGPLPARTVLVPSKRWAHALRRALLDQARPEILGGTQFLTFTTAAALVVRRAAHDFSTDEAELRPTRLRLLFQDGLAPEHFDNELLTSRRGWPEAFARTIGDLERAGCRPNDLDAIDASEARGLKQTWEALDRVSGSSWTPARVLLEAAERLEADAGAWPFDGAALAVATVNIDGAAARFVRAIPLAEVALRASRPLREPVIDRVRRLLGERVAGTLREAALPPRRGKSDRQILAAELFERRLSQTDRAREPAGDQPDGTVTLEEHSGVETELEATATWVAREILEYRTPFDSIAVLVPVRDPLAQLVRERIARLPGLELATVYVAGGVPFLSTTTGARVLAIIRALRRNLAADVLPDVLPLFRTAGDKNRPLTRSEALVLAYSLGTTGGSPTHPQGALDWRSRIDERERVIIAELAELDRLTDRHDDADLDGSELDLSERESSDGLDDLDDDKHGRARGRYELESLLSSMRAARPALDALVGIAQRVLDDNPLETIWRALRSFLDQQVRLLPDLDPRLAALDQAMFTACDEQYGTALTGLDALELIESTVQTLRLPCGRYGDPAVFVGTISDAAGLRFDAVRVIGLSEGRFPPSPREDPVLPDELRCRIATSPIDTSAASSIHALHALDLLIQEVKERITFSAPRLGHDRSYRELSPVFLQVAMALGRRSVDRGGEQGDRVSVAVVSADDLRRHEIAPARESLLQFRLREPIGRASILDRVAAGDKMTQTDLPSSPALDYERIAALWPSDGATAMDGLLGPGATERALPGLDPERPLSASRLRTLLSCPHRFLFESVLHFHPPPEPRSRGRLDNLAYGSLFHRVAERFYREHGAHFMARRGRIDRWLWHGRNIADREFDALLQSYPLANERIRNQQRERLHRDVDGYFDFEWSSGSARAFVASERSFGYAEPLALITDAGPIYVRGFIDLLERRGDTVWVRDIKTGSNRPRRGADAHPVPVHDSQIALYALVAKALSSKWELPDRVAAGYVHTNDRKGRERAFEGSDFDELEQSARGWLVMARGLLTSGEFPRTTSPDDCTYCPFTPVCGWTAYARAKRVLADADGALAEFREMKS